MQPGSFTPDQVGCLIQHVLDGPAFPDREYIASGATFAEVYRMAENLRKVYARENPDRQPVCLAAEKREVIAAALLASLAGGPLLLLPYAFSPAALARLHELTGFPHALIDVARPMPEGVRLLRADEGGVEAVAGEVPAQPREELLHIFTGGSTGNPMVWAKTGMNLFGEALYLARRFGVTEKDTIVATVSPYHIYGLLFSVILPLVSSASVVQENPSFPGEIATTVQREEATILAAVPPHYRALKGRSLAGRSLRLGFSSAGMLDAGDNAAFQEQNGVGVVEVYGSTETGGIATRNRAEGEEHFTPFSTVEWKIDDGLLQVRSPYISPGVSLDADGFFTAGDRVEQCGPGCFALRGRADTITKVGGKRVDLEEITSLVRELSGVEDCVVLTLPVTGGREHDIVVLVQGDGVSEAWIRGCLAGRLEPYAMPRRIMVVSRIPVTGNGKYDRPSILRMFADEQSA